MPPKTVLCSCGHRNNRVGGRQKCVACSKSLRKTRRPPHEAVLDKPYEWWAPLSVEIHGGELDACAMCGKPKPDSAKHERDHDHKTGWARGLLCYRCNNHYARFHTLETARALVAFFERVDDHYARVSP